MDTVPLPPRPDLAQYRKRAKNLVKAAASPEPDAVRVWAAEWLGTLARLWDEPVPPFVQASLDRAADAIEKGVTQPFTLTDAQFLIARAHGFDSWAAFARHLSRVDAGPIRTKPPPTRSSPATWTSSAR